MFRPIKFEFCRVAIIIKTLNEEGNISRCIKSALAALDGLKGQVIVADSGSIDSTVAVASLFNVKVVQLTDPTEKSCGIGAQLGFQFSNAEYVYVLDGDMEIDEKFIHTALDVFESDDRLAGIAGIVEELGGGNYEFSRRKASGDGRVVGSSKWLDMGGLYRVSAISRIGYLTNRNLHSYEEKELGLRLTNAGYSLRRIPISSVKHYGKTENSASLLWNRWRAKHLNGPGEWIRATGVSLSRGAAPHFKQLFFVLLAAVFFVLGMLGFCWSPFLILPGLIAQIFVFSFFAIREKSLKDAAIAYLNINICSAGMVRGYFSETKNPNSVISAIVIKE